MDRTPAVGWLVGLAGVVATIAVAGGVASVAPGTGAANVALALAAVVVVAGLAGQRPGALVTAAGATLSYNFFHTEPVHTLRIAAPGDVATVVLLGVIGVMVGELSHRRVVHRDAATQGHDELAVLHRHAQAIAALRSTDDAVFHATAAVARLLEADSVWFERAGDHGDRGDRADRIERRIEPDGTVVGIPPRLQGSGLSIGVEPVALEVGAGTRVYGRMVVVPAGDVPMTLDARRGAAIVVRELGLALAAASAGPLAHAHLN